MGGAAGSAGSGGATGSGGAAGGGGASGSGGACTMGTSKCMGNDKQTCMPNGLFGNTTVCGSPCSTGQCVGVAAIYAGGTDACVVTSDGNVECWGDNSYGQRGAVPGAPAYTPAIVPGLSNVSALAVGFTTCAISGGALLCLGWNGEGELGNGTTSTGRNATPAPVPGMTGVTSVAVGGTFVCAVQGAAGNVYCWGATALGNGTAGPSLVPVQVSNISGAVAVTAGRAHACALLSAGNVMCWGADNLDQLGDGNTSGSSLIPVQVRNLTSGAYLVQASSGGDHTCALVSPPVTLDQSGAPSDVVCWGADSDGQLGEIGAPPIPTSSPPACGVADVQTRGLGLDAKSTCAILEVSQAYCWGYAVSGELGYPQNATFDPTPGGVSSISRRPSNRIRMGSHVRAARRRDRALLGIRVRRTARKRATAGYVGDARRRGLVDQTTAPRPSTTTTSSRAAASWTAPSPGGPRSSTKSPATSARMTSSNSPLCTTWASAAPAPARHPDGKPRQRRRLFDHGTAGHWLPGATCRQEMGALTAPPPQHLKPAMQSVSAAQDAPAPPSPGMQDFEPVMSVPAW